MVLSHFIIHTNIFISPCISNLLMFLEIILVSISSYLYFYLFRASFSTIWFDRVLENLVLVILSVSPPWRLTLILLCDIDLFVCKSAIMKSNFRIFQSLGGRGLQKICIPSYCWCCRIQHDDHIITSFELLHIENELIIRPLSAFYDNPPSWWLLRKLPSFSY